jgi:methionyl-tRNA formyltransferase
LLPAYRGAAPIQWAVANGEARTGVTSMQMDPGMDTGPILLMWETTIGPDETAEALAGRMSMPGAELMVKTLAGLEAGSITSVPQDNYHASKAPLLKREHGLIDWNLTAQQIYNRLRGFTPWPGIYTGFRDRKLQIWQARPNADADRGAPPGSLLVTRDSFRVVCGEGTSLELLELQIEGRRRMVVTDFVNGFHPKNGENLLEI